MEVSDARGYRHTPQTIEGFTRALGYPADMTKAVEDLRKNLGYPADMTKAVEDLRKNLGYPADMTKAVEDLTPKTGPRKPRGRPSPRGRKKK
jgi:diacylglycerol kinase family enzyme